ncbi:MAG: hypothetical protein DRG30_09820, partial [Epsilonproteobacteria bacterium]
MSILKASLVAFIAYIVAVTFKALAISFVTDSTTLSRTAKIRLINVVILPVVDELVRFWCVIQDPTIALCFSAIVFLLE